MKISKLCTPLVFVTFLSAVSARCLDESVKYNRDYQVAAKKLIGANARYVALVRDPDSVESLREIEATLKKMDAFRLEYQKRHEAGIEAQISSLRSHLYEIEQSIVDRTVHIERFKTDLKNALDNFKQVKEGGKNLELNATSLELEKKVTTIEAAPFEAASSESAPTTKKVETTGPSNVPPWDARERSAIQQLSELKGLKKYLPALRMHLSSVDSEYKQLQPLASRYEIAERDASKRSDNAPINQRLQAEIEFIRAQTNKWRANSRLDKLKTKSNGLTSEVAQVTAAIESAQRQLTTELKSNLTLQRISAIADGKPDPSPKAGILTDWEQKRKQSRLAEFESTSEKILQMNAEIAWIQAKVNSIGKELLAAEAASKTAARVADAVSTEAARAGVNATKEQEKKTLKAKGADIEAQELCERLIERVDRAADEIDRRRKALELQIAHREIILALEPDCNALLPKFSTALPAKQPEGLDWIIEVPKPAEPDPEKDTTVTGKKNDENTGSGKIVLLKSGEKIESSRVIDAGDSYSVKTEKGIKTILKADVKEIQNAK